MIPKKLWFFLEKNIHFRRDFFKVHLYTLEYRLEAIPTSFWHFRYSNSPGYELRSKIIQLLKLNWQNIFRRMWSAKIPFMGSECVAEGGRDHFKGNPLATARRMLAAAHCPPIFCRWLEPTNANSDMGDDSEAFPGTIDWARCNFPPHRVRSFTLWRPAAQPSGARLERDSAFSARRVDQVAGS